MGATGLGAVGGFAAGGANIAQQLAHQMAGGLVGISGGGQGGYSAKGQRAIAGGGGMMGDFCRKECARLGWECGSDGWKNCVDQCVNGNAPHGPPSVSYPPPKAVD